jgi:hypothetical protein
MTNILHDSAPRAKVLRSPIVRRAGVGSEARPATYIPVAWDAAYAIRDPATLCLAGFCVSGALA